MNTSRRSATLLTSFLMLLAMLAASPECLAAFVYFDGGPTGLGTAFVDAANWDPDGEPGANLVDILGIDDGFNATFSDGTTRVRGLRVGSAAKEHASGEIHFGQLTMTGGSLEVTGSAALGLFGVGRENQNFYPVAGDYNKNTFVDGPDFLLWQRTLGQAASDGADGDESGTIDAGDLEFWEARFGNVVRGGRIIMTGSSTLTANGVIIGERTKGLLSIGPQAVVDLRTWDTLVEPNQFGGAEDMRIGSYGPAFDDFGAEPGLDGDGLVDVQGELNAKDLYMSEHGAKGELRLSGGTVNLSGALIMDLCDNCVTDPDKLALRSAKVSIIGSGGTFNVGLDPDPAVVDPTPPSRDILANSPTAIFSFQADAGGVTPITLVDNGVEPSGVANIDGATLQLNLDAFPFTSTSTLTLIDALPGNLSGEFGLVTFVGNTTADVHYDGLVTGNVFLDNFQNGGGAGAGLLAGSPVPEPSGLVILTLGLLVFSSSDLRRHS